MVTPYKIYLYIHTVDYKYCTYIHTIVHMCTEYRLQVDKYLPWLGTSLHRVRALALKTMEECSGRLGLLGADVCMYVCTRCSMYVHTYVHMYIICTYIHPCICFMCKSYIAQPRLYVLGYDIPFSPAPPPGFIFFSLSFFFFFFLAFTRTNDF